MTAASAMVRDASSAAFVGAADRSSAPEKSIIDTGMVKRMQCGRKYMAMALPTAASAQEPDTPPSAARRMAVTTNDALLDAAVVRIKKGFQSSKSASVRGRGMWAAVFAEACGVFWKKVRHWRARR